MIDIFRYLKDTTINELCFSYPEKRLNKSENMTSSKIIIFIILFSVRSFENTRVAIEACNYFFDYCDFLGEDTEDIKEERDIPLASSYPLSSVSKNYSTQQTIKANKRNKRAYTIKAYKSSTQITTMLDKLLRDSRYDKQIRPEISGTPIEVILIGNK